MKLGFSLKKAKKSGLQAADSANVARAFDAAPAKKAGVVEKVYVTDFDPNAVAPSGSGADGEKRTLVIPLLKANAWKAPAEEENGGRGDKEEGAAAEEKAEEKAAEEKKEEMTEDERAAQQLLADVQSQQNGDGGERKTSATLVIPMKSGEDAALAAKRAKLYNLNGGEKSCGEKPKAVPILQQNAVPGMDDLADVTDKYRHDVALRPNELDVHSEAYDSVPIEDFGAAMLRGMGWKGTVRDDKEDADDPKPRQKLLGLGATAKPKLAGDTGKNDRHRPRRGDDKPRSNGLNRREEAEEASTSKRDGRRGGDDKRTEGRDRREKRDGRERDSSRARSRSRERSNGNDRDRARKSDRDGDDRRKDRRDDRERDRDRDRRGDRGRDRERSRSRDSKKRERGDRDKRKRSRSRDRSHDRKRSSRH